MRWPQSLRWGLLPAALLVAGSATAADRHPGPAAIEIAEVEVRLAVMGFALERPDPRTARKGSYGKTALTLYSPGLYFWVDILDLRPGDHLVLSLKAPDGGVMAARDLRFDLAQHRYFAFAGTKRPSRGWAQGSYTGKVEVVRGDRILVEQTNQIALP